MAAVLQSMLGDRSCAEFLSRSYLREVAHGRTPSHLLDFADPWTVTERVVATPDADLLVVRDGAPFAGSRPSLEQLRALYAAGYTVVLRDPERFDSALFRFSRALAFELHGRFYPQLYLTPAGHGSFGWHLDPEEVFVFQLKGRKRISYRDNTLHPQPLKERLPTHLRAIDDTSAIREVLLSPGDWLYLPDGTWHAPEALDESVTLSLGILAPTAFDALTLVANDLQRELAWRVRLPAIGSASPLSDEEKQELWAAMLRPLGEELARRFQDPQLPARLFASSGFWSKGRGP